MSATPEIPPPMVYRFDRVELSPETEQLRKWENCHPSQAAGVSSAAAARAASSEQARL
jgi:hypothetical protein